MGLAAPPLRVGPRLGAALGTASSRCPHRGRAMEAGCWLLGGEFEDSVFEERRERRPGPPASFRAKLCEPQVRGRGPFPPSRPPVLAWVPASAGPDTSAHASPAAPAPTWPPVVSNHREDRMPPEPLRVARPTRARRAHGDPRAVSRNPQQAFGGRRCAVLSAGPELCRSPRAKPALTAAGRAGSAPTSSRRHCSHLRVSAPPDGDGPHPPPAPSVRDSLPARGDPALTLRIPPLCPLLKSHRKCCLPEVFSDFFILEEEGEGEKHQ